MDGQLIDRLISGAGAVAAGADDWGRGFGESEPRLLRRHPASIPVAILLFALAGLLLLVGIETTAPPTAGGLRAGDLAGNDGLGQKTYATVSGSLASTYVANVYDGDDTNDSLVLSARGSVRAPRDHDSLRSAADRDLHLADTGRRRRGSKVRRG